MVGEKQQAPKYRREEDGGSLKAQLVWRKKCIAALTPEEWKYATTKRPLAHYRLALKSMCLYAATAFVIWKYQHNPFIWVPAGYLQGSWCVAMIFMMHEACHRNIFNERTPLKDSLTNWSGRLYGLWNMNSMWFFRIYHLQHHHQFFQGTDDPKSTHFVPKDNVQSKRIAYIIPGGLIKIFKNLRRAYLDDKVMTDHDESLSGFEANVGKFLHLSMSIFLIYNYGPAFWMKIHFLPHIAWFPLAFMINRCGQHYCCNPKDSALQSTNVIGGLFWDLAHAYSEYHVEHHTFGEVPNYNLKALNKVLRKRVYEPEGIPQFWLSEVAWNWFFVNKPVYKVWYEIAVPYSQVKA